MLLPSFLTLLPHLQHSNDIMRTIIISQIRNWGTESGKFSLRTSYLEEPPGEAELRVEPIAPSLPLPRLNFSTVTILTLCLRYSEWEQFILVYNFMSVSQWFCLNGTSYSCNRCWTCFDYLGGWTYPFPSPGFIVRTVVKYISTKLVLNSYFFS